MNVVSTLQPTHMHPTHRATAAKIVAAFAVIYFVWGTTFLGIKLTLAAFPPFTAGGIRMVLAAAVMFAWLRWRDVSPLKGVNWPLATVCGVLLIGVGNGFVVWAQQSVPSGIAALMVASVPAFVLLFNWVLFARVAPSRIALLGMTLAMGGFIVVIVNTRTVTGHVTALHLAALVIAVIAWSVGTLLQRRTALACSVSAFTCAQLLLGGLFQLALALTNAEWREFEWQRITPTAALAMMHLVIFGSVVGFNCYLWLLQRVPAQRVATYALVNPIVALALGAMVANERLSFKACMGIVLVLTGVAAVIFEDRFIRRFATK